MNRLKELLQTALPPTRDNQPPRDLWPDLRRRIDESRLAQSRIAEAGPASPARAVSWHTVPWFDWALAGGVAGLAVAFPAALPLFLYYL